MNSSFNYLLLLSLVTFTFASDYVTIKVHNYTTRSQNTDGSCTEDVDIYLTTYCGTASDESDTKSSDSCSAIVNEEYIYTTDECDTSDSVYFKWTANNDCDGNFASWIIGGCAQDYQLARTGALEIDSFECGWNGPYIKSAIGSDETVSYSLYKPCEPTSEPTPSPTAPAYERYFQICINSAFSFAATDDADKIQVRLWTDDSEYNPTEWRYISPNDGTIFNDTSKTTCYNFYTFYDIYAQWYVMDLSMCSTDGIVIDRIMFWDMETESHSMISSFNGDSDCIKLNGAALLLDADSTESSNKNAETSTKCQRLSVNLSYESISFGDAGDTVDQSESTSLPDSDDCTSF